MHCHECNLSNSKKERIQVVWDDGSYEGWLIDWSAHPHYILFHRQPMIFGTSVNSMALLQLI